MSWVDTAAVCLAVTSRRRISFFFRALDAAALQAALWRKGGQNLMNHKGGGGGAGRTKFEKSIEITLKTYS